MYLLPAGRLDVILLLEVIGEVIHIFTHLFIYRGATSQIISIPKSLNIIIIESIKKIIIRSYKNTGNKL